MCLKSLRTAVRIQYTKKFGHVPNFFDKGRFEMVHECAISKRLRPEPPVAAGVAAEKQSFFGSLTALLLKGLFLPFFPITPKGGIAP